jgi:hypothetical protein
MAAFSTNWRWRWAWRRTARSIVAEHAHQTAATLGRLQGHQVRYLADTPAGHPASTIWVFLSGWTITLADVAAAARVECVALAQAGCHLSAAGRYGQFWWLTVTSGPSDDAAPGQSTARVTVLGSRVTVRATGDQSSLPLPGASSRQLVPRSDFAPRL